MFETIKTHKITLTVLVLLIAILSFAAYQVISSDGIFSGLKNDYKPEGR